ncbi:MAG TPA: MerR family transcriptional regulator [Actinomycetota bacterium]|nr:MerR family transcriptional regulator [Actinomycetota bacterium]
MRYRVDELAARSGTSVDTVRYYQSKGLLPPPRREGRVAWYSDEHLDRLARIRALKADGFTLASIQRLLDRADPSDAALAAAVAGSGAPETELTLEELAEETGVSAALLAAVEREGLLSPRLVDDRPVYSRDDAEAVRAGLSLLEAGLPLGELLALARRHDEAMRAVAQEAVDVFARFVRDPIRADAETEEEAAERLVEAFRAMLPAVTSLVARHFRTLLLAAARERIESSLEDAP